MITDKETNLVYFSGLLAQKYPKFFKELRVVLERKGIEYDLLPHTKDIWCRDYMPIQISKNEFVRFAYRPGYLTRYKKYRDTITDATDTCKAIGIKPKISRIKIDGGNIVKSLTKAIITERIFSENKQYGKQTLLRNIKKLLKVKQIIIIPECPYDWYGHADGMIRFIDGVKDERTVLANDFSKEAPELFSRFHRTLSKEGLYPVVLPYNPFRNKANDVKGIYINYLQAGKIVIYPAYGIKEDLLAQKVFSGCFGAYAVPIRANAIAKEGGVLNCVSWNISKGGMNVN
jgi:agmatine deiminase